MVQEHGLAERRAVAVSLKRRSAQWPWQALLAVILLGMAASLWVATKRVNYEWRWERVPQYFVYRAEEPQTAPVAGAVQKIGAEGAYSRVDIAPEGGGQPVAVTVETDTLKVKAGDSVAEGDNIGAGVAAHHLTLHPRPMPGGTIFDATTLEEAREQRRAHAVLGERVQQPRQHSGMVSLMP